METRPSRNATASGTPTNPPPPPGNAPTDTTAYDYWDHLDYAVDQVADHGMYAALVIAFNAMVVGNGRGQRREQIVFTPANAYRYGRFVGARYGHHEHIIWMLGGDRSPVYGEYDYRPVYHAMAEGVADGINGEDNFNGRADYSGILMSYHPRKAEPASSTWFHGAPWNSFNSIQTCPDVIAELVRADRALAPTKPTWLFEGRYEEYTFAYRDWIARFQAYRALTAGGLRSPLRQPLRLELRQYLAAAPRRSRRPRHAPPVHPVHHRCARLRLGRLATSR